jgi:hypothetical protein
MLYRDDYCSNKCLVKTGKEKFPAAINTGCAINVYLLRFTATPNSSVEFQSPVFVASNSSKRRFLLLPLVDAERQNP